MDKNILKFLPEADLEELLFLEKLTYGLDEDELEDFLLRYKTRRKKPEMIIIMIALGFLGFAGIHRFYLNKIFSGVLFLFTCGFCFLGTIIDLINHRNITRSYNRELAYDIVDEIDFYRSDVGDY